MARAWLRRVAWVAFALALLGGLWCALAWWVLPPWLKSQAETRLSAALQRPTTIERIEIDPWRLTLTVERLAIAAADPGRPPQLTLARFAVDIAAASLRHLAPVLDSVELDGLRVALQRTGRWKLDVDDLLQRWLAPKAKPGEGGLPRFVLRSVQVRDAALMLDDLTTGRRHRVDALSLAVAPISTLPDDADRPIHTRLTLNLNGSPIRVEGEGTPWSTPRRGKWQAEIERLDLAAFAPDLNAVLPLRLAAGRFGASIAIEISQDSGAPPALGLAGRIGLTDVQWRYASGEPALAWHDLRVQLAKVQPLARRARVERVELDGMQLPVVRDRAGNLNLAGAIPPRSADSATPPANASAGAGKDGWQVEVGEVAVKGSSVGWHDATTSPAAALDLSALALTLKNLRWPMTEPATAQASAQLGAHGSAGGRVSVDGQVAPGKTVLQFAVEGLALPSFRPYLAMVLAPPLRSGVLSARGRTERDDKGLRVTLDEARIDAFALGEAQFKRLAVKGLALDPGQRQARIGSVRLDAPRVHLARDGQGRWNLASWLREAKPAASGRRAAKRPATAPWRVQLDRFDLTGGRLDFDDALPAHARDGAPLALRADALRIHAANLHWPPGKGARPVALRASGQLAAAADGAPDAADAGAWALAGRLSLSPLAYHGALTLDRLPLAALLRYAPLPPELLVIDARAVARTQLGLDQTPDGWRVKVEGDAALDDLRVDEDPAALPQGLATEGDLLRWRSLAADGLLLALTPGERPSLAVRELKLVGLDGRMLVTEQGRLNLATVAATARGTPSDGEPTTPSAADKAAATGSTSSPEAGLPLDLEIGLTRLVDGRIDFEDRFIQPNYRAELSALDGQLGKIRSGSAEMAAVVLGGRVADTGKLEVSGNLNPTARPLALNLRARATDIDLPPLSSYSGKYAGYGIAEGKLSVDVSYRVDPDGKLKANNRVVLNKLRFGEPVESASATKLPVRFIASLLEDRNGVIDINLPIEGSVNQPEFRLGPVIIEVLLKLLGRAVSSPFSVIAGDGADNLGVIEFVPGTTALASAALPALDKVAAALAERPALTLDVVGQADPAGEREPFRRAALDARLAALRPAPVTAGAAPAPLADDERNRLLRRLYRQTPLPDKPLNALGAESDLEPAAMTARLLAAIPAGDDAMRDLALQRGLAVRAALIGRGMASDRLFVGQPVLHDGSGGADAGWTPRVQLTLLAK